MPTPQDSTPWQARHLQRYRHPLALSAMAAARSIRQRWLWAALALLAVLLLALLLGGLRQVLNQAVQQGETLRATTRQQGEAFWHCNALGSAAERHDCRHQSLQPRPAVPPPEARSASTSAGRAY